MRSSPQDPMSAPEADTPRREFIPAHGVGGIAAARDAVDRRYCPAG